MGSLFVLSLLWLSFSSCSLVHCVTSTTQSSRDDQPLAQLSRRHDDGFGAVVAQLIRDQSTMNAKQQVMEVTLEAAKKELEVTKTDLEATKTDLEATKTDLEATKTRLEASETKLEATETKLEATETKLEATETKLEATETKLEATTLTLENTTNKLQAFTADVSSGSSFVRWGRKTCPNNTTLVYTGIAGGKYFAKKGSGTNPLCLTGTPQFDNTAKPPYYATLYGAEYDWVPGHHHHDVPCSVCLAPQSTTIMVPATLTCPPGWTPHYTGHLVAQNNIHFASEYVCLDGSPEDDSSGVKDNKALVFNYVMTVCGSLRCPPYINDKVVTCVVCSK